MLATALLPLLLHLILAPHATAEQSGDFSYTSENGSITITGYTGLGGDVAIPATISNVAVTAIGYSAFSAINTITNVTLPDTVTNIGNRGFSGCGSLATVNIGFGVRTIGDSAFAGCSNLTTLIIPNQVSVIEGSAFFKCASLRTVTIGSGLAHMYGYPFWLCTGLEKFNVNSDNTNFTSLGDVLFQTINLMGDPTNIGGVLFNKFLGLPVQYPAAKTGTYTIPDGVWQINAHAFSYATGLTRVTIPASVRTINGDAFAMCASLAGVYFEGDAPDVGSSCFLNATNATVYYLPRTARWGSAFGGRPAVLWNPQFQTTDATFGIGPDGFGFTITGTADIPILVEASAGLPTGPWCPRQSCLLTNGSVYMADTNWPGQPRQFYRIRPP
jgi:hypothetical protein